MLSRTPVTASRFESDGGCSNRQLDCRCVARNTFSDRIAYPNTNDPGDVGMATIIRCRVTLPRKKSMTVIRVSFFVDSDDDNHILTPTTMNDDFLSVFRESQARSALAWQSIQKVFLN